MAVLGGPESKFTAAASQALGINVPVTRVHECWQTICAEGLADADSLHEEGWKLVEGILYPGAKPLARSKVRKRKTKGMGQSEKLKIAMWFVDKMGGADEAKRFMDAAIAAEGVLSGSS